MPVPRLRRTLGSSLVVSLIAALLALVAVAPPASAATGQLVITGVVDGPLTGGTPKAVELYALTDITDLSEYGIGSANNGGGTAGVEFTFPAQTVPAGTHLWVAAETPQFEAYFGFAPTFVSGAASSNGDDAIELFRNGAVVDVFGDIAVDGTGQPWDHMDGWAYCVADTGQDGSTFTIANWTFSGINALDNTTTNATAPTPWPIGTYTGISDGGGGGGGGPTITPIHAIQGPGSTVVTGTHTIEAVVVGDFQTQGSGELRGFFVQEEDADVDADPATSEGLFVFCSGCPTAVAEGDLVQVTGIAPDFFDMSQLTATTADAVSVVSSGNPLPTPATVDLPIVGDVDAHYEAREGMRVTYADSLVVSEYFQMGRFGQVILYPSSRPFQYTQLDASPTVAEYAAHLDDLARSSVILDDDDNRQNSPLPAGVVYHPQPGGFSTGAQGVDYFRGGDTVASLTGVLHRSFAGVSGTDAWRVRPTAAAPVAFTPGNTRSGSPAPVGGSLKVASFNVLNLFSTLDAGANVCGPSSLDCRGAHSATELQRQLDKIVAALTAVDADIVGVIEIENNATASLQLLVDALPGYAFVDTGTIGTDAIKVGFIYRTATVGLVGAPAILDSSVDPTFVDTLNRPALTQSFEELSTGEVVTVTVNHLQSKGSDCNAVGDLDAGDGQGNCNGTRTAAATAIVNWLSGDPTASGDPDHLIIGDLNAYAGEDPIRAITSAGYTDLLQQFVGAGAYGYVFDGQLGTLDHSLANPALAGQVTGATSWHINADEVHLFDYDDTIVDGNEQPFEAKPSGNPLYAPDPFRSSDHDPVVIGLALASEPIGPSCNGLPATIVGTDGPDRIRGTNGPDVIVTFGGSDVIEGRGGDDVICAGGGDNRIEAGAGDDVVVSGSGDDRIDTGAGNDTVDAGDGANRIDTGAGDDVVVTGSGDDRIVTGSGSDTVDAGDGANRVDAGAGNDSVDTGSGADRIDAASGDDDIRTGAGNDRIDGAAGNDTIDAGDDVDRVDGGPGTDICVAGENVTRCEILGGTENV